MPDEVRVDDLTDLWRAGAVSLPQAATQYAELARAVHKTGLSQEAAFTRSIGGLGPLFDAWCHLRNTVQNEIAVRSHDNLVAAGEALTKIADSYATTDHLSAEDLSRYEQSIEEIEQSPVLDDRPPAYVPDAPSSTDPHPEQQAPRMGAPF